MKEECKHETFKILSGRCEKINNTKWSGKEMIKCSKCGEEGYGEMYVDENGENKYRTNFEEKK